MKVLSSTQYSSRSRRLPEGASHEREEGPRARDFVFLFIVILVIGVVFILFSLFQESLGLHQVAMGVRMFGFLALFVAGGTGVMAGLAYLLTGSLVKRELEKKVKRLDAEREALIQRMHSSQEDPDS